MTIWSFYHKTIEFLHHGFKSSKIRLFSLLKTGILKYLGKIQLVYLVIEEGNWLHLQDSAIEKPEGGFDALTRHRWKSSCPLSSNPKLL